MMDAPATGTKGNVTLNTEPLPSWLVTAIVPPWASTMAFAIANPIPVPCTRKRWSRPRRGVSRWKQRRNVARVNGGVNLIACPGHVTPVKERVPREDAKVPADLETIALKCRDNFSAMHDVYLYT